MNETKHLVCIGCPMGCNLQVTMDKDRIAAIDGYACKRGEQYARDELMDPRRMVTSLVAVEGSRVPLSVKTRQAIPKPLIADCIKVIRKLKVELPVAIGDVIAEDILGTGVDIVATRALPADDKPCP